LSPNLNLICLYDFVQLVLEEFLVKFKNILGEHKFLIFNLIEISLKRCFTQVFKIIDFFTRCFKVIIHIIFNLLGISFQLILKAVNIFFIAHFTGITTFLSLFYNILVVCLICKFHFLFINFWLIYINIKETIFSSIYISDIICRSQYQLTWKSNKKFWIYIHFLAHIKVLIITKIIRLSQILLLKYVKFSFQPVLINF